MAIERESRTRPFVRTVLIVVAVILLVPILLMAFMMPMMGMMGGGMWAGGASAMSPLWGLGMMLLFLLVLLAIGYAIYRAVTREALNSPDPALEELRLAYARGDLSQEEFERRREDLRQSE